MPDPVPPAAAANEPAKSATVIPPVKDDDDEVTTSETAEAQTTVIPADPAAPIIPPVVPPAKVRESDKISAALLAQRRAQRSREANSAERRQLEADKAALEAEKTRVQTESQRVAKFNEDLKTKPLEVLQATYGLTYDDLTKMRLNGGALTPEVQVKLLSQDLNALRSSTAEQQKAQQEAADKRELERSNADRQRVLAGHLERIKTNITPETHPVINFLPGGAEAVQQEILTHWNETYKTGVPVALDDKAAADRVEARMAKNLTEYFRSKAANPVMKKAIGDMLGLTAAPVPAPVAPAKPGSKVIPQPKIVQPKEPATSGIKQAAVARSSGTPGTKLWDGAASFERFKQAAAEKAKQGI